MVTSSHMENKAAGAWVRGAPCCGLCLEAAEPVAQTRLLAVTVGLGDGISGGWSASPGKHLLCRIVLHPEVTGTSRGNTGYTAATRERPQESVFNVS